MATTTTTESTQIPPYLESAIRDVLGQTQAYFKDTQYQPYTGQRFAGVSPLQQQAIRNLQQFTPASQIGQATGIANLASQRAAGLAGTYTPYQATNYYNPPQFQGMGFGYQNVAAPSLMNYQMQGPADVTSQTFGSQAAQQYMSPYVENVLERQKQGALKDYRRAMPGLGAAGAKVGGLGGTRNALVQAEAQRNLYDRMADIETSGLQSAYERALQQYNADQAQRMQAALANQQMGYNVGTQNLQSLLGVQQLGAGQSLQAQQANQSAALQAQQQQAAQLQAQNQFAQQNAANAAQYGLAGANLGETSRQFGANLGLQGIQAALQGAGQLGQLGQTAYQQGMGITGQQLQVGAGLQGQEQAALEAQYQDFLARQQYPQQQLGFYSNIVRGVSPNIGSTTTSSTQQPSGSSWATGLGLLGGLATLSGLWK